MRVATSFCFKAPEYALSSELEVCGLMLPNTLIPYIIPVVRHTFLALPHPPP